MVWRSIPSMSVQVFDRCIPIVAAGNWGRCRSWHWCLALMECYYVELGEKNVPDKRSSMSKNTEARQYSIVYGNLGVFHVHLGLQIRGSGYRIAAWILDSGSLVQYPSSSPNLGKSLHISVFQFPYL